MGFIRRNVPWTKPGLLAMLFPAALEISAAGEKASPFASVDLILAREVDRGNTPSVQYVHFGRDSIIHVFRKGHADLEKGIPVAPETRFNAYSLTKVFTAVAVMRLAEEGRLDLDDPVRIHLPGAPVVGGMTILHLLSHTSGLANPMPLRWIHGREDHPSFNRDGFFAPILGRLGPQGDEPGVRFRYSNLNYVLLGQIMEAVTGSGYEDYVQRKILDRLGAPARGLGFKAADSGLLAEGYHPRYSLSMLALGFLLDKERYMGQAFGRWRSFKEHFVNGAPYGGLIGNAGGLVTFGQALLHGEGGLLKAATRDRMFRETRLPTGEGTGMALGWFVGDLDGRTYYAHAGGGGGYYCELRLYPEQQVGSFLVFNRSGFSDARFLDRVDRPILPPR
jgi:CubicO group peptidase (beta-lactamase class C family)